MKKGKRKVRKTCCAMRFVERCEEAVLRRISRRADRKPLPPEPTEDELVAAYEAAIDW